MMKTRFIFSIVFFIFSLIVMQACGILVKKDTGSTSGAVLQGEASYYADKFQGRPTASGEKYDKNKLTAAHKSLPFGTQLSVKNLKNQKTVSVKVNDRLPKSSKRVIDLSRAAARQLDMIRAGVVPVEIKILNQ